MKGEQGGRGRGAEAGQGPVEQLQGSTHGRGAAQGGRGRGAGAGQGPVEQLQGDTG